MNKTINPKQLLKLNNIYRRVLGRDVDESGIQTYLNKLNVTNGETFIEHDLRSSQEFKNLSGHGSDFNSLTGDRVAYIKSNDTSLIDNSPFKDILNNLIRLIVLVDNPTFDQDDLDNRVTTVKKSLINSGKNNLPFTIFPHLEYLFNTDRFDDSLKNYKNFQYYLLYMIIANVWKILFNKQVDTCGTAQFVRSLNFKAKSFDDIIHPIKQFFINYFSIRISGRLLSPSEIQVVNQFIDDHRSDLFIDYLRDIYRDDLIREENIISQTLSNMDHQPSVLVMIAYLETQSLYFIERMMYHCSRLREANPLLKIDFALDNDRVGKESGDYTPWSRVKRIRNMMINRYDIHKYDYLYIIDSDIIDYPHDFLTRAIGLNPEGITAPVALIQNSIVFYDWCGYQKKGNTSLYGPYGKYIKNLSVKERNFNLQPPYVDDNSRLVEIDCVGCTYVVPSKVFNYSYGNMKSELIETFSIAGVTNHKIHEDKVQYEDHPCFTDHFTICAALRANGGKVFMDRGSAAYHADLPIHGEAWH
jgi:hypothetical protein